MDPKQYLELRPGILADCTGALFLQRSRTLLVADAHLGYAWAQRRRGELGPLTDGGVRSRLRTVMARWNPDRLVFLGDVVHLARPSRDEREAIEETLLELGEGTAITVVPGNHDRGFVRDFGHLPLDVATRFEDADVVAVHGDQGWPETTRWLVLGHLHPSIRLPDSVGVRQRLPVFLMGSRALVLPAFSPFAAGFNLGKALPASWRLLFGEQSVQLAAATGTQVRLLPRLVTLRFQQGDDCQT